jgi:O-acetylserine/cysteine efflux transporter
MFRNPLAALCVLLPLILVTELGHSLMVHLDIGMKINTLCVVALGVGPLLLSSWLLEPHPLATMRDASWVAWFGVAYAAVAASLLGHGLYYRLVQRHPVAQVTPYLLATPLLATLLGIVVLHDRVGPRLWIGGAMVLGGVLAIALHNLATTRPVVVDDPAEL